MRLLLNVLLQLDEARRYIEDGRIAQLRLALLLLDNAVELQLEHVTRDHLWLEELRAKSDWQRREFKPRFPDAETRIPEDDKKPLTEDQMERVRRFFDEKVNYLQTRTADLDAATAASIKHLHKYRNEAYHAGFVRRETLRTAALILLDINCELLLNLKRASSWSSSDDYSWFEQRFGLNVGMMIRPAVPEMVEAIRSPILPDERVVADVLASHLVERVEDLYDSLDFVVDNSDVPDRSEAIRVAAFIAAVRQGKQSPAIEPPADFRAPFGLRALERIVERADAVRASGSRIEAFHEFAKIERDLEVIEEPVHDSAGDLDAEIQHQVDILRGK